MDVQRHDVRAAACCHQRRSALMRSVRRTNLSLSARALFSANRNAVANAAACGIHDDAHVMRPTSDAAALTVIPVSRPSVQACCSRSSVPCGIVAVISTVSYTTPRSSTLVPGPTSFSCFIGMFQAAQIVSNLRTASSASASDSAMKMKSSM